MGPTIRFLRKNGTFMVKVLCGNCIPARCQILGFHALAARYWLGVELPNNAPEAEEEEHFGAFQGHENF